jgi:uncharacterized membrane protein YqaE (UPF0057 family)
MLLVKIDFINKQLDEFQTGEFMGFWRVVITILLPPLGVLIGKGFGWAFILNIILTLLGYIPGLIHGFWVQTRNPN